jgi:hypothetical protein
MNRAATTLVICVNDTDRKNINWVYDKSGPSWVFSQSLFSPVNPLAFRSLAVDISDNDIIATSTEIYQKTSGVWNKVKNYPSIYYFGTVSISGDGTKIVGAAVTASTVLPENQTRSPIMFSGVNWNTVTVFDPIADIPVASVYLLVPISELKISKNGSTVFARNSDLIKSYVPPTTRMYQYSGNGKLIKEFLPDAYGPWYPNNNIAISSNGKLALTGYWSIGSYFINLA